jgi:hypothetical protein
VVHVIEDPLEYIRKRPQMFLRSGRASGLELAEAIVGDALILTGGPVTVFRRGDWWVIGCEEDWMTRQSSGSVDDLFFKMVAFPEAGPNSMHSEVLLTAFATEVLTKESTTVRTIKGFVEEDDEVYGLLHTRPQWKRGVAFRIEP